MEPRPPRNAVIDAAAIARTIGHVPFERRAFEGGAVLGPASAYTLKIRGGCEGGGKGALVQEDASATLSTRQDQTLFQSASKGEAETRDRECSGFLYHGSANARSIGHADEQSPTITSQGKPPAVAFAQNSRDEVRLVGGDGSLAGAAIAPENNQPAVCLSSDTAKAPCDVGLSGTLEVGGSVPIVAHEK